MPQRVTVGCANILLTLFGVVNGALAADPPRTVDFVDLERYMGRWYEIAALPNFFQRHCVRGTTADYSLAGDGLVSVTNRCETENGEVDEARGVARSSASDTNDKLEVSFVNVFGKQLFWGDYWIIGLGKDYEYALVGTPSRRWGWILARKPNPSRQEIDVWLERLREQGYDPKAFVLTDQSARGAEGVRR
jgi:apolipoprotein D and lipocalin family protein